MSEVSNKNVLSLSTSQQLPAADKTSSPLYVSSVGNIVRHMPGEAAAFMPVWTPQDEEAFRRSTYDDLRHVMNRLEALMLGCQQVLRARYNEASGAPNKADKGSKDVQAVMLGRVMRRLAGEAFDFSSAQEVRAEADMIAMAAEPTKRDRIVSAAVQDLQTTTRNGELVTNVEVLRHFVANRDTAITDAWSTRYVTAIRRLVVLYQSDPVYLRRHIGSTLSQLVQYEVPYLVLLRASQGRLTELTDTTTQAPPLGTFASPTPHAGAKSNGQPSAAERKGETPKPRAQPPRASKPPAATDSDATPSALDNFSGERTTSAKPVAAKEAPPPVVKPRPSKKQSSSPSPSTAPRTAAPVKKAPPLLESSQEDSIQFRDASQSPQPYPSPATANQRPPLPTRPSHTTGLTSSPFVVDARPRRASSQGTQEIPPCTAERKRVAVARSSSADRAGKASTADSASTDEPTYRRLANEKAQNTNSAGRPVALEHKCRTPLGVDSYFSPQSNAPAAAAQRSSSPPSAGYRTGQGQQQGAAATRELPAQRVERAPMSREQQLALYDDVPPFFIPAPQSWAGTTGKQHPSKLTLHPDARQERVTSARGSTGNNSNYRKGEVRTSSPNSGSPSSPIERESTSAQRTVRTAPMPDTVVSRNRSRSPGARRR